MCHHLDSPMARQDIRLDKTFGSTRHSARQDNRLDITDLYVFRGQSGTAFVINVCHSIFGPIPVPGYHPEGMYEFKVDLNGDAVEELTYRFTFNERDRDGSRVTSCAASRVRMRLIRTRKDPSLRKALPMNL